MPHCSLDFCTIMLPGSSSSLHSLAINPPSAGIIPSPSPALRTERTATVLGFSFFSEVWCPCHCFLFFVFFLMKFGRERRSTNWHILAPNKLIVADVPLHGCNLESQPTSLIYIFIRFFFCLSLIASLFKSNYIRLSLHWVEEKRKRKKIAVHLRCICGFLLTRFWIVGVP